MKKKFELVFRDRRQGQLFLLLIISTMFNFALLSYRLYYINYDFSGIHNLRDLANSRGVPSFFFLVWNLFLAWIPYWVSLSLPWMDRRSRTGLLPVVGVMIWLLFFPNAPYILTDLLHLQSRWPVPHWYDLMLITSFAWTGLMLGFFSLLEVHRYWRRRLGHITAWTMAVAAIFLCGFGVYLGRFQRWNSWDVFVSPATLLRDALQVLLNPTAHLQTLGVAIVISVFMLLGYLTLTVLLFPNEKYRK